MTARFTTWLTAVRTPLLVWSVVGLFAMNKTIIANLLLLINHFSPGTTGFNILLARPEYLCYLPNAVTCLVYVLGCLLLLEVKQRVFPRNRSGRMDLVTALIGLLVAASSLAFMTDIKEGCLQLFMSGMHVMSLWTFLMLNSGLFVLERLAQHPWTARMLNWTFPVSDLLCYQYHRQRLGSSAGWIRFIPTISFALIVGLALALEGSILWRAIPAQQIDEPISMTTWAQYDKDGLWFSTDNWFDPLTGIWYYDERSRTAAPFIRVGDVRRFYLEAGYFYYHDRYDDCIYKVDEKSRQVVWKVPVKPGFGTFEVTLTNDLIFAVAEGGYILALDREGRVHAEREVAPIKAWAPQAIWGDRVAFVSGDQRVRIWNNSLTESETIPLPVAKGVLQIDRVHGEGGIGTVTNWTDYDPDSGILYLQVFWGEIFRYDAKHRRWLPSFKAHPGLRSIAADGRNGLFFAGNYLQGYIEVMDLDSGAHLGYILANSLGRFINIDPAGTRGVLTTHGYGLYQFEYGDLLRRRRSGASAVPQQRIPEVQTILVAPNATPHSSEKERNLSPR